MTITPTKTKAIQPMISTEEQTHLRQSVGEFLDKNSPESEVRRLSESAEGFDRAVWRKIGGELGLTGIHIPERFGGQGYGYTELEVVLQEMGKRLYGGPFLASAVLGSGVLLKSGNEIAMAEFLPGIACGELIATVGFGDADMRHRSTEPLEATESHGTPVLSGSIGFALDADVADVIFVFATWRGVVELFAVHAFAPGMQITSVPCLDATRRFFAIDFTDVPAQHISTTRSAADVRSDVVNLACIALAAESIGGASAALNQAVSHARGRFQFGRAIGSFQAIKHKCANMLVDVELATSAAEHACRCVDEEPDNVAMAAAMAKAFVGEAYVRVAAENIQIHGGMGFTWEHPAHLYLKRAKCAQLMFGDPIQQRKTLAGLLGI
ncbi:acyl-CoA dehydrogenase family protein [Mycobacterium sp. BMJ-28]